MEEITIKVPADTETICCDGGQDGLGHPAVYYSFDTVSYTHLTLPTQLLE